MLGVGLWGRAKGNSHMGKGPRARASMYFGQMSSLFFRCNLLILFISVLFFWWACGVGRLQCNK